MEAVTSHETGPSESEAIEKLRDDWAQLQSFEGADLTGEDLAAAEELAGSVHQAVESLSLGELREAKLTHLIHPTQLH